MAAAIEPYLALVAKAFDGRLQLPAFQRKWKPSQVILLYDSLRQGYPIGGFLFIKRNPAVNLGPREFRGAQPDAGKKEAEFLVLDGQQRITAGIELFYGGEEQQYFLDLNKLHTLFSDRKFDVDAPKDIKRFLEDLDADERYCVAKKPVPEPEHQLLSKHLLATTLLASDDELTRSLRKYKKAYPDRVDFIDLVIDKNFRPAANTQIPITFIDEDVTIEAISRIFSTLNSTGKMLTPFELVVSILYPDVRLVEDVEVAKEAFPYYKRVDRDGDILLQSIALFAGKDTKKSSLPKTIDVRSYQTHSNDVWNYLNKAAKLLTEQIGLGLDQSDELLVYPVIFPPMAYLMREYLENSPTHQIAQAQRKLAKWFIGAVLRSRYQQSTHDKQARDKFEILHWLRGDDKAQPQWLNECSIPVLRSKDPDSAIGKLLRALMNASNIRDPITNRPVGVGSQREQAQKHHIFPTKHVRNLPGWNESKGGDTNNIALNIMYVEQNTNATWLNADPALQITQAIKSRGSEEAVRDIY